MHLFIFTVLPLNFPICTNHLLLPGCPVVIQCRNSFVFGNNSCMLQPQKQARHKACAPELPSGAKRGGYCSKGKTENTHTLQSNVKCQKICLIIPYQCLFWITALFQQQQLQLNMLQSWWNIFSLFRWKTFSQQCVNKLFHVLYLIWALFPAALSAGGGFYLN